jgi:HKD family nuclease
MSFFITPHSFLKTVDSPRSFKICSPYVTEHGLGALIDVLRPFGRPVEILIGAKDGFNDPDVLRRLLNESLYMRWNAKWSPTDELHAKIYAVQQNNSDWRMLITSANLTKAFTGAGIEAGMVRTMSDDSFQSSWQDLLTRA